MVEKRGKSRFVFFVLFAFLIFSVIFSLHFASAVTRTCWSCGNCSSEIGLAAAGDVVQLNQSIAGGNCIAFNGRDNIIFDCNATTINASSTYGIWINALTNGSDNNTIRNCNINGASYALDVYADTNTSLINVSISSSYGVYLRKSNKTFINNVTSNSNTYGFYFDYSNNNSVYNSTAYNNNYGFYLYPSSGNILDGVNASGNTYGVYINSISGPISSYNRISNSFIQENFNYDFYMSMFAGSSDNDCNQNLTNVTGSGGRLIEFYNYSAVIENKTLSELVLCNADGAKVKNVTIDGSDFYNNSFFKMMRTDNSNFTNINSSGNNYGIYLYRSSNNTFSDIVVNREDSIGLVLETSHNNTFYNLTSSFQDTGADGIQLISGSLRNIFRNITTSYVSYGFYLQQNSNNNSFVNINSSNNSFGFAVSQGYNNTFDNVISRYNAYGFRFLTLSGYNTLTNSFIEYNVEYGLYFSSSGQYNLIYNNYFNNSAQYYNTTSAINYFNTTKTAGTNIVGGTYIGGNYWASLNGTGFSQTCALSTDGICDSAYNIDGLNYDYLPLTCIEDWSCGEWGGCSVGTQTRTCSDANLCQTYKYKPIESQSCDSWRTQTGEATQTQGITSASAGGSASVGITNPRIDMRNITIFPNTNISNASITVTENESGNIRVGTEFPEGTVYQAFTITTKAISNEDLNNVTLEFRVNKTWLAEQNKTYDNVVLYRVPSGNATWQELTTVSIREDSTYYYFLATSPGFSTFVILVAEKVFECDVGQKRCFNDELQSCIDKGEWILKEQCKYGCKNARCILIAPTVLYIAVIAVISFGIIIILARIFKHRKR